MRLTFKIGWSLSKCEFLWFWLVSREPHTKCMQGDLTGFLEADNTSWPPISWTEGSWTSSRRMTSKHANYFRATDRGVSIHAFRFLCVLAIDVYARHRFSESLRSRLDGLGQKALQTMNEFTLFVDFCLILYPRPVPLTYQPRICKDGFISIVTSSLISLWNATCSTGCWSIIGRCFGACQQSSCADERRPQ